MPTAACPGDDKERVLLHNKPTPAPARALSVWLTQEEANTSEISLAAHSSGPTFSITILVTVKLSVTCMSQKQFNPFSTDFFFPQGKKK